MLQQDSSFQNVDEYISQMPATIQKILTNIRRIILKSAPDAIESISYKMPAYKFHNRPLIYFAAFKKHIGIYATPESHEAFSKELATYKQGKGSVQFPLDQPIPYELIERMVVYKVRRLKNK